MKIQPLNFKATLRIIKGAIAIISSGLLLACSGGTGSANNESVLGTTLGNPVTNQIAIAYIKRPIPVTDISASSMTDSLLGIHVGAKLYLRDSASINANETNISAIEYGENALYDVKDLQVSNDGKRLIFAMHAPETDVDNPQFSWNIWEYDITSNQLTPIISGNLLAEEGDDINPIFLANGEIAFSSTRQKTNKELLLDEGKPQYSGQQENSARNANEPDHALVLHKIDSNKNITQISFNQSYDYEPLALQTGEILYTRHDNINNTNRRSLYRVNPSGGNISLTYGYHSQNDIVDGGVGFINHKRLIPGGGVLAIVEESNDNAVALGGDLVEVDIDNYTDNNIPTTANTGLLSPAIHSIAINTVEIDNPLSPGGRYISAWPLDDSSGRIIVSWSPCRALDNGLIKPCSISPTNAPAAAPLFSLWNYDPASKTQLPIVLGEEGFMISDVAVLESREILSSPLETIDIDLETATPAQLGLLNIRSIYDIDGLDSSIAGIAVNADPAQTDPSTITAKFIRIVKAVSIPDEDVLDFDNVIFGISNQQLMREIIGYVPIEPDGSVRTLVPANIPFMIDIVDANARRINPRHENWLHVGAGTTLECRGCHANGSTTSHGRLDAQAPSVHLGATATLAYPNTETQRFSPNGGETMAELYALYATIPARTPSVDVIYTDEWTDETNTNLTKATSFTYSYQSLNPLYQGLGVEPPTNINCQTLWNGSCRVLINYEQHIQPLWEAIRTPVDDGSGMNITVDNCVGCHTTNNGTRIPAGQLDLSSTPSTDEADHFSSYRELLRADAEQALNGGAISNRSWLCNVVVNGQPVLDALGNNNTEVRTPAIIAPTMSVNGANFNDSPKFFNCLSSAASCNKHLGVALEAGFPDECVETGGDPLIDEPIINHNGMLSTDELRLISEWLDIGAQYYNNPFDAPE